MTSVTYIFAPVPMTTPPRLVQVGATIEGVHWG